MVKKQMSRNTSKKKPAARKSSTSRPKSNNGTLERRLQDSIRFVEAANTLTSPLMRSIENLLRVAADAVGASEASVIVRDGNKGSLKFLSAIGPVAEQLLRVKIPPGRGIAGFVFTSGQPMMVANAAEEESFYAEVDRTTGYTTQTLLATPLRVRNEIIGVLELVNRPGEPPYAPFAPEEMDQSAHFADAIAALVDAYESAKLVEIIFDRSVHDTKTDTHTADELRRWTRNLRAAPEHRDMLAIAASISEIAGAGEAERELCREIIDALGKWARKRAVTQFDYSAY
jgi:transcriptional regulator with GAF, ATPase, and Fis domain